METAKRLSTPNVKEALHYLRETAKSYATFIPGSREDIESAFDALERLAETHRDEVRKIIVRANQEIRKDTHIGGKNPDTANRVIEIVKGGVFELEEPSHEVGSDVVDTIMNRHSDVMKKLSGPWDELRTLAKKYGAEGSIILEDASKRVEDIFKEGIAPHVADRALALVEDKIRQLKGLGSGLSKEAENGASAGEVDKNSSSEGLLD